LEGALSVRPLERRDVDRVLAIQSDAPELAQWTRRDYQGIAQGENRGWVVESGERVVGFLIARAILDEIEVLNVATALEVRREGCGAVLLKTALEWGRNAGARRAFLEVRASNVAAKTFYEKHGFSPAGRRPKYYTGPIEDALIFAIDLN
jgi:[ribosomal protein S18]-alanine N-acetyltransferase